MKLLGGALLMMTTTIVTVCGCSENVRGIRFASPSPPGSPTAVRVSGTLRGERFDFECAKLTAKPGTKNETALIYGPGDDIFVSCESARLGIAVNTHIKHPSVGALSTSDDGGRIAAQIANSSDAYRPDIITTDATRRASGFIEITEWNPTTKHLRGSSTMWWSSGSESEKSEVRIDYDVSRELL